MSQRPNIPQVGLTTFRFLSLAAVAAVVAQITLGGVVRITGSGLGCPDWPLCHGQIIPSFQPDTLIEYSHRLSATIVGFLVLATTVMAWRICRNDRYITGACTLALVMVIVAAILGGVTVLTELTLWAALLHLGIAELVVACMAIALVHGWNGASKRTPGQTGAHSEGWYDLLLAFIVFSTFALILSGSYMVRLGYGFSCATWPLCRGSVFPEEAAFLLHMAHRYAAVLVGIFIVGASLKAWVQSRQNLKLFWVFSLAFGIFVVQVLIGAGMLWWGYSSLRALHLLMATLLWLSVVIVTLLHFRGKYTWVLKSSLGLDREPGTERVGP